MKSPSPVLSACLYIVNNILVKAFQFFLVPIYTAYLSTEQYGVSNLITSFTMIASVLVSLSIGSATARIYVDCRGDKKEERTLFSSLFLFVIVFGLIVSFLFLLLRGVLTVFIFGKKEYMDVFALIVINLWLLGIVNQYKSVLTATQEANTYTAICLTSFITQLLFTLYFILYRGAGVMGIIFSMIIANALTVIFSIYDMLNKGRLALRVDFDIINSALKYSIPLIPHSLSSTIAQFLSRVFIGNSFSLSAVGIYGLAGQFGNIIDTMQGSVHTAYIPWFFAQQKRSSEAAAEKVRSMLPVILSLYNLFFLGIALFSQELIAVIAAKEYYEAWKLIPVFVLVYSIKTAYYFYVSFLFYDIKRVRYIFIATLSSSFLNVVLSAFLVPNIGMYGAALADLIATIVQLSCIIRLCSGDNLNYFKYSDFLQKLSTLVFMSTIGLLPGYLMNINHITLGFFLYKAVIWVLYCAFVLNTQRNTGGRMFHILLDKLHSNK